MASSLAGTTTAEKPSALNPFHRNARKGDVDAIAGSLVANGQYTPIIVNIGTQTGRPNEVLAGNHTLAAIKQLAEQNPFEKQWSTVLVHWLDVDDEAANKIVVADNQTFALGEGVDVAMVASLLHESGLKGTGYTEADLAKFDEALESLGPTDPTELPEPPSLPEEKADRAIGYTLVFDDTDQEARWFEFVKYLKDTYDDPDLTIAERLLKHLDDTKGDRK